MYKDKAKQKEAVRLAVRRYRSKSCNTHVIPDSNVIPKNVIPSVIPSVTPKLEHWRDGIVMINKLPVAKCKIGCPACLAVVMEQFRRDESAESQQDCQGR